MCRTENPTRKMLTPRRRRFVGKFAVGVMLVAMLFVSPLAAQTVTSDGIGNGPGLPPAGRESAAPRHELKPTEVYRRMVKAAAWIGHKDSSGTAWIVDARRGLLITNRHVVGQHNQMDIVFPQFKQGEVITDSSHYANVQPVIGTVIDTDRRRDLALVQVRSLPPGTISLKLAAKSPAQGTGLHAVGAYPIGTEAMWKFSLGHVLGVAVRRKADGYHCKSVEHDAHINGGNSGGPIVNAYGELVAVVSHTDFVRTSRSPRERDFQQWVEVAIDVTEVKSYLQEVLPLLNPSSADQFHRRAFRHHREGRYRRAIRDYTKAIDLNPDLAVAIANRGWAFYHLGDLRTALADFGDAIRHRPTANAYWGRGLVQRKLGDFDASLGDLTECIRLAPDADAYYDRGQTYFAMGQFQDAVQDFSHGIKLNPNEPVYYADRGKALTALGRYQAAVKDFQVALQGAPRRADWHNALGIAFHHLKQYDQAAVHFAQACKIDPQDDAYFHNCGLALRLLRSYQDALELLNEAVRLDQQDAKNYLQRGLIQTALGNYGAADLDFVTAARLDEKRFGVRHYRRYLRVTNDTGEPLKVCFKYYTKSDRGEWKWYPGGEIYCWQLIRPGETVQLYHGDFKLNAYQVNMWAVGQESGAEWSSEYVYLAPKGGYVAARRTHFTYTFTR